MPAPTQRRNAAYLNRLILTNWCARPRPGEPGPSAQTGLAVYLRGSFDGALPTGWRQGDLLGLAAPL